MDVTFSLKFLGILSSYLKWYFLLQVQVCKALRLPLWLMLAPLALDASRVPVVWMGAVLLYCDMWVPRSPAAQYWLCLLPYCKAVKKLMWCNNSAVSAMFPCKHSSCLGLIPLQHDVCCAQLVPERMSKDKLIQCVQQCIRLSQLPAWCQSFPKLALRCLASLSLIWVVPEQWFFSRPCAVSCSLLKEGVWQGLDNSAQRTNVGGVKVGSWHPGDWQAGCC